MDTVVIKSNRIVLPTNIISGYVIISNGIIRDITDHLPQDYIKLFDVGDKVLMPGVVDPHVHINDPGRSGWEGFDTATKAAIAGGITTLVDMPLNSLPVTTTVNALKQKIKASENRLHTDCGFWGGIIPGNASEVEGLIDNGVLGFKAFLTHSGIDEFPNVREDDLLQVMPLIAKHDLPLLVHCELEGGDRYEALDPCSYNDYLLSRPGQWEDDAIALMIRLCERFRCKVHIVHLASSGSIEQIRLAKKQGLPLTVETAPHYLYFASEDIERGKTIYKCAPPIRDRKNRTALWEAMKDGTIDFVATDHSPAPPEMKQIESGNFMKAWGGISSLQFSLPVLWTAAREKGFGLIDLVKWLAGNPSKLIGEHFKKGRIEKGCIADLTVMNPDQSFVVQERDIQHNHKITPYLDHELYGVVEQTWLGGTKVFDRGKMKAGQGKILLQHSYKNRSTD